MFSILLGIFAYSNTSLAQERNATWKGVTNATAIAAGLSSVLMPRIFYSSPEATVGWKARWHVSVLAPVMTHASLALLNEAVLKDTFESPRPGCEDEASIAVECDSFGLLSTQSYVATASLGQGVSIFFIDMFRYSGGRFHFGALAGHVIAPLTLSAITVGGRVAGNHESAGQALGSAGIGLGTGLLTGLLYGMLQKPSCGYGGDLICW